MTRQRIDNVMSKKGWLILEDGTVYEGEGFGAETDAAAEFVFNTGMTGYESMLSDPVNAGLGIVATFPSIGNWGAAFGGKAVRKRGAAALVCREISCCPPNNTGAHDLSDYMLARGITGLCGVDTRRLTKQLRAKGSIKGTITFNSEFKIQNSKLKDNNSQFSVLSSGLVKSVTVKEIERKTGSGGGGVAIYDLGGAERAAQALQGFGFGTAVYPAGTAADDILKDKPYGIVICEGPGDPADCAAYLPAIKSLMESGIPVFGIGLGHQLMARASGFKTVKLPQGHRGANYPVKETATGNVYITAQNHGYAVDATSVNANIADITYVNLHDGSVEGIEYKGDKCASLQFFPETGPYVLRPNAMFLKFKNQI